MYDIISDMKTPLFIHRILEHKNVKRYYNKEGLLLLFKDLKKPFLISVGIFILLLLLTPVFTYLYFARDLQSKEGIMNSNSAGVILTDRNDKPFFTFYKAKARKIIPINDIPPYMQQAVIASEDKNFYNHPGFSLPAIARALYTDISEQELKLGASTITQQLVKNVLLTSQKNFFRKYQEITLAFEIDRRYSKKEILEMYLNSVYFGQGAIGVEQAAQIYYGKNAKNLTLAESALLSGILPAPSAYSPISGDKDEALVRQKIVLTKMVAQGYVTEEQKTQALAKPLTFAQQKDSDINTTALHFALMVKDELVKQYGEDTVARSGFRVKTTIDLSWQQYAETIVKNQTQYLRFNRASNGAVVVLDPKTGEIRALVGSKDWNDEEFGKVNMALTARQPGSSFKPFIYAKAFADRTITPATVLEDKQITFYGSYKPKNYDGKFRGPVLPRRALANSLNVPAVAVMEKVGVPNAVSFAKSLGITTLTDENRYGLSLVLGAAEVPLLEMADAFAVFANRGKLVKPTTILEITDKRKNSIYSHESSPQNVLDADVAFLISSILSDNSARVETFGNALTISRPAAVKTGTTEDYRDALTVGYTPSLVVGVWVGNNDNTPMDNIAGSLGAAPIWRQLMERFLQGTPVETFNPPSDLIKLTICKENGGKTTVATSSAYPEFFIRGTEPTKNCGISPTPSPTASPTPNPSDTPTPTPTKQPDDTPTPTVLQPTSTPTPQPTPTFVVPMLTPTNIPSVTIPIPT